MKSIDQLAQAAFTAYRVHAGSQTLDGQPLPLWEELSYIRQACWVEAARAVVAEIKHLH